MSVAPMQIPNEQKSPQVCAGPLRLESTRGPLLTVCYMLSWAPNQHKRQWCCLALWIPGIVTMRLTCNIRVFKQTEMHTYWIQMDSGIHTKVRNNIRTWKNIFEHDWHLSKEKVLLYITVSFRLHYLYLWCRIFFRAENMPSKHSILGISAPNGSPMAVMIFHVLTF